VGRLAIFRELKALFILARQTTARIVHVIKHAKLQSCIVFLRILENLPSSRSHKTRAAELAFYYPTLRAI
jgi:hypothetical protein